MRFTPRTLRLYGALRRHPAIRPVPPPNGGPEPHALHQLSRQQVLAGNGEV